MSGGPNEEERVDVFTDIREPSRAMRVTDHGGDGVIVFSLWNEQVCRGTFQMPVEDAARMIRLLDEIVEGSQRPGAGGRGQERMPGGSHQDVMSTGGWDNSGLSEPQEDWRTPQPVAAAGQPQSWDEPTQYYQPERERDEWERTSEPPRWEPDPREQPPAWERQDPRRPAAPAAEWEPPVAPEQHRDVRRGPEPAPWEPPPWDGGGNQWETGGQQWEPSTSSTAWPEPEAPPPAAPQPPQGPRRDRPPAPPAPGGWEAGEAWREPGPPAGPPPGGYQGGPAPVPPAWEAPQEPFGRPPTGSPPPGGPSGGGPGGPGGPGQGGPPPGNRPPRPPQRDPRQQDPRYAEQDPRYAPPRDSGYRDQRPPPRDGRWRDEYADNR